MIIFRLSDGRYEYRPLRLKRTQMRGWDVWALQKGLLRCDIALDEYGADGYFGNETKRAVKNFQGSRGIWVDGIAGTQTQRELCLVYIEKDCVGIKDKLAYGQVEKESGFLLGNHTPIYQTGSAAGFRDCGVLQMNTKKYPEETGFNPTKAFEVYANQITTKFVQYMDIANALSERRCWELAAGSWNAPAWTDILAHNGTLSEANLIHIESYIERVTTYVEW